MMNLVGFVSVKARCGALSLTFSLFSSPPGDRFGLLSDGDRDDRASLRLDGGGGPADCCGSFSAGSSIPDWDVFWMKFYSPAAPGHSLVKRR